MRIAIQSHAEHEHHHLPHQGMWFVFMLTLLLMFLSTLVTGDTALFG
jgi:hypothetical protein